jgi:DNA polymerase-3 subunit gamma/tau
VLERVSEGEGGEMMAALLADARPVTLEDDVLVLAYPASASFSKRKLEDRSNGQRLGRAVELVAGRPIVVRFEVGEAESETDPAAPAPPAMSEEELIARFKDEFDAEDVEEADKAAAREET